MKKMNFNLYGGKSFIIGSLAVSMLIIGAAQGMRNNNRRPTFSHNTYQANLPQDNNGDNTDQEPRHLVNNLNIDGRTNPPAHISNSHSMVSPINPSAYVNSRRNSSNNYNFDDSAPVFNLQRSPQLSRTSSGPISTRFASPSQQSEEETDGFTYDSLENFIEIPCKIQGKETRMRIPVAVEPAKGTLPDDSRMLTFPPFEIHQLNEFMFNVPILQGALDLIIMEDETSYLFTKQYGANWRRQIKWLDNKNGKKKYDLMVSLKTGKYASTTICGQLSDPKLMHEAPLPLATKKSLTFSSVSLIESENLLNNEGEDRPQLSFVSSHPIALPPRNYVQLGNSRIYMPDLPASSQRETQILAKISAAFTANRREDERFNKEAVDWRSFWKHSQGIHWLQPIGSDGEYRIAPIAHLRDQSRDSGRGIIFLPSGEENFKSFLSLLDFNSARRIDTKDSIVLNFPLNVLDLYVFYEYVKDNGIVEGPNILTSFDIEFRCYRVTSDGTRIYNITTSYPHSFRHD